jgi:hypothetical protein
LAGDETYLRPEWQMAASEDRLAESVSHDRMRLRPQFNRLDRVGVVDADGAFVLSDFAAFCRERERMEGDSRWPAEWPRAWLAPTPDARPFVPQGVPPEPTGVTAKRCRIAFYAADEIVVDVDAAAPAVLVLAEQFYPGWTAERSANGVGEPLPVLRVHGALRGVRLPAGAQTATFRYRPTAFYAGAALSTGAWLALIGWSVWLRFHRRVERAATRASSRRGTTTTVLNL